MSTLLQVSDPHFGAEWPAAVDALVALVTTLRPDLVVLSGDLTQRARRRQFDAARAFVDRLGPQALLAIPGNHDIPLFDPFARLWHPYARYRHAFGADLEPVFDAPTLLVQGVNTTRPARHTAGEISAAQIERVARRFELARPAQLRVAVVHQPIATAGPSKRHDRLHGAEAALRRWADAGVDLVLGGHTHRPEINAVAVAGSTRKVYAIQGGTAVSWRVRDGQPNSVNLIAYDHAGEGARRARVTRYEHDAAGGRFVAGEPRVLDLTPAHAAAPAPR
ncbi:metallophosphoesterase [Burkholderia glumae]|uniref:metallophosphoesterase family protein n=1 Tax=Burkholderia glumae TaxID=337 RepID=UPI000F5E2228|nr:metallophosphoesterase [Burkholderia glumae]MCQ0029805.1 metallophosphoesterase [Burkholderia glumae]MCQ0039094.1 metallophosphoesterase [Burkholderia glumae]QJW77695.1 metallophosphoesterase [Burkholderia glumae]RQZ73524.1 metallophosphoesterase [Burkholderia glumae]UVS87138.1 metallophosphoesterase [Burkholderia glumae]